MNLAPVAAGDARAPAFGGTSRGRRSDPSCRWRSRFIYSSGKTGSHSRSPTVVGKTTEAWTVSILAVLGLVIALNSLGLSVPDVLGSIVHGAEHILNRPL